MNDAAAMKIPLKGGEIAFNASTSKEHRGLAVIADLKGANGLLLLKLVSSSALVNDCDVPVDLKSPVSEKDGERSCALC